MRFSALNNERMSCAHGSPHNTIWAEPDFQITYSCHRNLHRRNSSISHSTASQDLKCRQKHRRTSHTLFALHAYTRIIYEYFTIIFIRTKCTERPGVTPMGGMGRKQSHECEALSVCSADFVPEFALSPQRAMTYSKGAAKRDIVGNRTRKSYSAYGAQRICVIIISSVSMHKCLLLCRCFFFLYIFRNILNGLALCVTL